MDGLERRRAIEEFQDRHQLLADRVEQFLRRLVILGLIALALAQTFQLNRFSRLAALEGVAVAEVADWSRSGAAAPMRIRVASVTQRTAPGARLLVDGTAVGDFRTGSVAVEVRPGQRLAIDGTGLEEPLTFRVVEATGVAAPELGTSVTTTGDRQPLGIVRISGR